MSCDFQLISLEQIGKIITGKTPPSKINDAFSSTINVPFITPKDMDGRRVIDSTERYLSDAGLESVQKNLIPAQAVCVSCIGSDMGKAVISHSPSVTNQQINTIVVDQERFDYRYIYYSLSTKQQELKDISGGSATPILNKGHFGKFEISIPTLEVQKKIADSLDCLDLKIELNRQINQTLEEMAQAIFKSWFVDFDPVKAKVQILENGGTENDANLAAMSVISGKSPQQLETMQAEHPDQYQQLHQTASLFPNAMQTTELGEIPDGWSYIPAESVFDISIGKTPPRKEPEWFSECSEQNIPWLSIRDMGSSSLFSRNTSEYLTQEAVQKFNVKVMPKNTVFLSFKLTLGRVSISNCKMATNEAIAHFKPNEKLPFQWLYLYLKQFDYDFLGSTSSIATAVNSQTIKKMPILISNKLIIGGFIELVEIYFEKIRLSEQEILVLTSIRDALLPKLLSGELQISTEDAR